MANRSFSRSFYTFHEYPVLIDCNFIVDSTNASGLGTRSLKGEGVENVFMHTSSPLAGSGNPNPTAGSSMPANYPNLASSAPFAILAASAITNSASAPSVITGNFGISPNGSSSVTGFPPGTVVGTVDEANGIAAAAQVDANNAYTAMNALSATTIANALDGQTLTPGIYKFSAGSVTLASSTNGTLTFNGAGVYIFQVPSTLVTGAGGIPTFSFTGGATASNTFIFWNVGSSATINSGVTSATSTFYGTIIAEASVTVTQGGTVDGRLFALTGAITLSNSTNLAGTDVTLPASPAAGAGGGFIILQLHDNYNRYFGGFSGYIGPLSGTPVTSTIAGVPNVIVSLGTATIAQWMAVGLPNGIIPNVGVSFIPTSSAVIGGSAAVETALSSGIDHIEVVGDPNQTIYARGYSVGKTNKPYIVLSAFSSGVQTQPPNGTVINLTMYLSNSSNTVDGE